MNLPKGDPKNKMKAPLFVDQGAQKVIRGNKALSFYYW
jgi:hypothetical protein